MKVQVRKVDQITILDCSGDVDLYSSPALREKLLAEMKSGAPNVLINMADVTYIDSSGIATLVEGLQLSRDKKTRFGLFVLRSNARRGKNFHHPTVLRTLSLTATGSL